MASQVAGNTNDDGASPVDESLPTLVIPARQDFRTFLLDLSSKVLFVIASTCYVGIAAVALTQPVKGTDSALMALFASFLFAIVGVLDLLIFPLIMGVFMILAGIFGVLAVAVTQSSASKALNCVSVHLFLIEAAIQLFYHRTEQGWLKVYLRSGDCFWVLGAFTDVILSYISIFGTYAASDVRAALFSAILWLSCSLVYVTAVIYIRTTTTTSDGIVADLEMKEEVGSPSGTMPPESKIV
jgi:hypothetical protein